mmetsp:Transcript_80615/g.209541  ORF Transcript_80615/g.209541 Transcript_80615/m.209541 type:complete len:80 (-) Transcript_80615:245-484(-)
MYGPMHTWGVSAAGSQARMTSTVPHRCRRIREVAAEVAGLQGVVANGPRLRVHLGEGHGMASHGMAAREGSDAPTSRHT